MHKECNLTAIANKLSSSSHGEIQLKLFAGEATLNPILLEPNSTRKTQQSFEEVSIDIIGFDKKKKKKKRKKSMHIAALAEDSK